MNVNRVFSASLNLCSMDWRRPGSWARVELSVGALGLNILSSFNHSLGSLNGDVTNVRQIHLHPGPPTWSWYKYPRHLRNDQVED